MCNAWNHPSGCTCDFGPGYGRGGEAGFHAASVTRTIQYVPAGFERANKGAVSSFITPNATCPVCKKTVWYYRSPYNGRVFFDDVGWPWPKHKCTDRPLSGNSPRWQRDGWQILLASKVYSDGDRLLL